MIRSLTRAATSVFLIAALNPCAIAAADPTFTQPSQISTLLNENCNTCHSKGKVRLDNLDQLNQQARLDMLNMVQVQVYSDQMPPKKKLQPKDSDALLVWVSSELKKHNASTLEDKLRYYKYANYTSHEKLFSGEVKDMPFTPARRWKINQFIYEQRVFSIFGVSNAKKQPDFKMFRGMAPAFSLPTESGVKYYDTDGVGNSEFLTLLDNAKYIAYMQLLEAKKKNGYVEPPKDYGRRPGTIFKPKRSEIEFEKVILSKENPADADLQAAIARQFQVVLQRQPTAEEAAEYLKFMKDGIKTNGVTSTLEKVLVMILMEPDFLYRSELGDGKPDAFGRTRLTPREASYALAYALTDALPDKALVQAANSGKLTTKEDYRREALRMLNDDSLGKPRILRFFQDFFGYYNVYSIFKDETRFGGSYNPHRASSSSFQWRVPGKVTKEADALVSFVLREDKDVLKQLLTTDKYFVHHSGDNDEMAKNAGVLDEIVKIYQTQYKGQGKLSDTQLADIVGRLKSDRQLSPGIVKDVINHYYNSKLPDRKLLPIWFDSVPHSVSMYNLNHLTWSYPVAQPTKIENRMGILTHPAWLISFAKNAETDPILRGKWIREKLLAGFVPDVPITVEAKVPEAPHQTLRQRISSVTDEKYCASCHQKMNPLGYPFESFDDFGRFRTEEKLENPENLVKTVKEVLPGASNNAIAIKYYKTLPVSTSGALVGTGDKNLDGEVKDAFDLIGRLGKSERVRQSFVRNVFRYFMGRNEALSDSKTLMEADKAYVESGGSFKALMVSLLTSDSFIYRK